MNKQYIVWLIVFLLNVFSALYNGFILITGISEIPALSLGCALVSTFIAAWVYQYRPERKRQGDE